MEDNVGGHHPIGEVAEYDPAPTDRARALMICLELLRTEAAELGIAEVDCLLEAAHLSLTDFVKERTGPTATIIPLRPTGTRA